MADQKLTDLTEETTPADTDLLYLVTSGSPAEDRKVTRANLLGDTVQRAIVLLIDGGGSAITTGVKADIPIEFDATITGWTLVADQAGTIQIDLWKDTLANFPPTDADSITGAAPPALAGSPAPQQDQDTTLSGWTTSLSRGDVLRVNVDSTSGTITRATLSLRLSVV